jgi:PAS domain S-box-containing protein
MARKLVTDDRQKLRADAEARLALGPRPGASRPPTAALQQELLVHQIELEMQNEELRQIHLELETARDQYVDLYDFAPIGYLTVDGRGHVARANLTAATLLGLERKNLVGRPFASFVAPGGLTSWKLLLSQVQASAGPHALDLTFRRKDGASFDGHLHCQRWDGPDADSGVRIVLADNSVARNVERALQERDAKLRAYFESPAVGIAITSPAKGWVDVNDRACAMLGYSRDELSRLTWLELTHPDDIAADTAEFDRLLSDEKDRYALDKRFIRKDGTVLWAALSVSCVRRPDHGIEYFVALIQDISRRKQVETALRESAQHQRNLFDNLDAGVVVHAPDTSIVQSNRKAGVLLGLTPDQMQGKVSVDPGWRFTRENGTTMPVEEYPVARVLATNAPVADQVLGIDRPGRGGRAWVLVNAYPELDEARGLRQIVVTFVDMTRRKEVEVALRDSEARFRTLADSSPVGIFQADTDGINVYLNMAAAEILGQTPEAGRGMGWQESLHADDRERVSREWYEAVAARRVYSSEHRFVKPGGEVVITRVYADAIRDAEDKVTGYVGVMIDATRHREAEMQLALASRLAALGTLVAGVAHEVNNPLAATLSDLELALSVVKEVQGRVQGSDAIDREVEGHRLDEVVEELEDAQEGARRIDRIVKELKIFARPDLSRQVVSLADIVRKAMLWLPAAVGKAATVGVKDGGAPVVQASFGQIEQVVVNLVTNAAKATKPGKHGSILIRIGPGSPGTARLDVVDQGTGIAPELLGRIFEPFFSTREVGKGMGLGLAVSHAIVKSHGGRLTVESEVGKGSTFRVELPAASAEA